MRSVVAFLGVQVKTFVIQAPSIYKVGFPLEMCQTFLILFFI